MPRRSKRCAPIRSRISGLLIDGLPQSLGPGPTIGAIGAIATFSLFVHTAHKNVDGAWREWIFYAHTSDNCVLQMVWTENPIKTGFTALPAGITLGPTFRDGRVRNAKSTGPSDNLLARLIGTNKFLIRSVHSPTHARQQASRNVRKRLFGNPSSSPFVQSRASRLLGTPLPIIQNCVRAPNIAHRDDSRVWNNSRAIS